MFLMFSAPQQFISGLSMRKTANLQQTKRASQCFSQKCLLVCTNLDSVAVEICCRFNSLNYRLLIRGTKFLFEQLTTHRPTPELGSRDLCLTFRCL